MVAGAEETGAGGHSCCLAATVMLHRGEGRGGGFCHSRGLAAAPPPRRHPWCCAKSHLVSGPLGSAVTAPQPTVSS